MNKEQQTEEQLDSHFTQLLDVFAESHCDSEILEAIISFDLDIEKAAAFLASQIQNNLKMEEHNQDQGNQNGFKKVEAKRQRNTNSKDQNTNPPKQVLQQPQQNNQSIYKKKTWKQQPQQGLQKEQDYQSPQKFNQNYPQINQQHSQVQQQINNKSYNSQTYNQQSQNNQSYNKQSYNNQTYNNQPYNSQSFINQSQNQNRQFQNGFNPPSQPRSYGFNQNSNQLGFQDSNMIGNQQIQQQSQYQGRGYNGFQPKPQNFASQNFNQAPYNNYNGYQGSNGYNNGQYQNNNRHSYGSNNNNNSNTSSQTYNIQQYGQKDQKNSSTYGKNQTFQPNQSQYKQHYNGYSGHAQPYNGQNTQYLLNNNYSGQQDRTAQELEAQKIKDNKKYNKKLRDAVNKQQYFEQSRGWWPNSQPEGIEDKIVEAKLENLSSTFSSIDLSIIKMILDAHYGNLEKSYDILQEMKDLESLELEQLKFENENTEGYQILDDDEVEDNEESETLGQNGNRYSYLNNGFLSPKSPKSPRKFKSKPDVDMEDVITNDTAYRVFREEALKKHKESQKIFKDIKKDYGLRNLGAQGQGRIYQALKLQAEARKLNQEASMKIFEHFNQNFKGLDAIWQIDLHGLHVEEALNILNGRLEQIQKFKQQDKNGHQLKVIVGRGLHSINNEAAIARQVQSLLIGQNMQYKQVKGVILINGPNIRARSNLELQF